MSLRFVVEPFMTRLPGPMVEHVLDAQLRTQQIQLDVSINRQLPQVLRELGKHAPCGDVRTVYGCPAAHLSALPRLRRLNLTLVDVNIA